MTVRASTGPYEVRSFAGVGETLSSFSDSDRAVVDSNVLQAWPELKALDPYVMPAGEASKSIEAFARIQSWLANSGARRKTRLWAVGGGVAGDLGGFVAATYMRGVPLVMVPTSLLAMVDSSVGGKVALDIPEGKNLVGAFWPPAEVRVATEFLKTLPERELRCGSAEVWKYGYILDEGLLAELESAPISLDSRIQGIIERCIALKAKVVEEDEFETTGTRAVLNFGHTIGHALESALAFQWTHGECISVGMVLESQLGERIGVTPPGTTERVAKGLASQGLPVALPPEVEPEALLALARRDKKTIGGGLAFSLLTGIGKCKLVTGVSETEVRHLLAGR